MTTADGGIINGTEDVSFELAPTTERIVPHPTIGSGISAHVDLTSLGPDFTIARMTLTFDERTLYGA
jgi:hypothetical protein